MDREEKIGPRCIASHTSYPPPVAVKERVFLNIKHILMKKLSHSWFLKNIHNYKVFGCMVYNAIIGGLVTKKKYGAAHLCQKVVLGIKV